MPTTDPIFQPTDLNRRGRAILDAAREGEPRCQAYWLAGEGFTMEWMGESCRKGAGPAVIRDG